MKINLVSIVLIIIVTHILYSCDPIDNRFQIENKSDKTIFVYLSKYDSVNISKKVINSEGNVIYTEDLYDFIPPGGIHTEETIGVGNAWKRLLENNFIDSTLHLFIFNRSTLEKLPDNNIISSKDALQYIKLNVKDLEKLNWKISYK